MKFFYFILLLIPFSLHAQIDSTQVPFIAYWNLGDNFDFEIKKSEKIFIGKKTKDSIYQAELKSSNQHTYHVNFRVLDSTNVDYTILYSFDNAILNLSRFNLKPDEDYHDQRISLIYKTTTDGEFVEVLNWDEVAALFNEYFTSISENLKDQKIYSPQMDNYLNLLKSAYGSKENIEDLIIHDITLIHFPLAGVYDTRETTTYEDIYYHPFLEKTYPLNCSFNFENIHLDDYEITMKYKSHSEIPDGKEAIMTIMKDIINFEDTPDLDVSNFNIDENMTYDFYIYPGIPKRIQHEKMATVEINGINLINLEKYDIDLLNDNDDYKPK